MVTQQSSGIIALKRGGQGAHVIFNQFLQGYGVQLGVDDLSKFCPDAMCFAILHARTGSVIHPAVDQVQIAYQNPNHVTQIDFTHGFGQPVSAIWTALAGKISFPLEDPCYFFKVFQRYILPMSDFMQGDRSSLAVHGNVHQEPDAVSASGRDFHAFSLLLTGNQGFRI